jgi:twitching motility protein PilT
MAAIQLKDLLTLVCEKKASDLHLTVGTPPVIRLHGDMRPLKAPPLDPDDTVGYMKAITPERCQIELKERGSADFGFAFEKRARFRVCVYRQKGNTGIAMRLIPNQLLGLEEIGLPPSVKNLLYRPRGLVLVTGPTGSGKTTTLASMINFINVEMDCHIITIEDPVEYYHEHKKSVVTQRELNVDVKSFSDGIRAALRMDPDVVLVGEMRDTETMQAAITAAETGHLVFGTLHTTGAPRTINRVIDAFPVDQQEQIRTQLASSLLAVFTQALLPRADEGGRIAAFEIMVMTPAVEHLIRENQTHKIVSAIQTGAQLGMILLDDYLFELYARRKISYQTMMEVAQNPGDIESKIKGSFTQGTKR